MRRVLLGLLATVLITTGSTLVASPVQAASEPVTIKKLGTQPIRWDGKATVKPAVNTAAGVTMTKKRLTVRKGGRVLHRNRASVKLKPGTYRLTTKVTYRLNGTKRTATRSQKLVVKQGRCATKANYRSVKAKVSPRSGDEVRTVTRKLHGSAAFLSDFFGLDTLADWREFFEGDAEARRNIDTMIDYYGEDATFDVGFYDVCGSKKKVVEVTLIDGHAVDKGVGTGL